jgi:hypothetical protein
MVILSFACFISISNFRCTISTSFALNRIHIHQLLTVQSWPAWLACRPSIYSILGPAITVHTHYCAIARHSCWSFLRLSQSLLVWPYTTPSQWHACWKAST